MIPLPLRVAALVLVSIPLFAAAPAWAGHVELGPAGDFNIFLFGDNTQFNSDVEGPVAVGGNVDFTTRGSGFSIASKMPANRLNLVVGGNFKNQSYSLKGGMLVNGNVDWKVPTVTGSVTVNGNANFHDQGGQIGGPMKVVGSANRPSYFPPNAPNPSVTPLPFDFQDVRLHLENKSSVLGLLEPNGTTEIYYNQVHLNATGPASDRYVFNVLGSQMANAAGAGLFINAPAGSTVVVNVEGSAGSLQNMGIFLKGVARDHVLYNFYEAKRLFLNSISVEGTILAPYADINFIKGQINGTLIGNNLTGSGESHWHPFEGDLVITPVPEPSSLGLACFGGAGLWFVRQGIRSARQRRSSRWPPCAAC